MHKRHWSRAVLLTTAVTSVAALTGCGGDSTEDNASGADKPLICVDFPRSDTDFWNAFINYVPTYAEEMGLNIQTTNSDNDVQRLVENVDTCVAQGAQAIIMAPQDTAAIAPTLDRLAQELSLIHI